MNRLLEERLGTLEPVARAAYIARLKTCPLAVAVKLNDLRSNMDLSRIPHPTEKDHARHARYQQEYAELRAVQGHHPIDCV